MSEIRIVSATQVEVDGVTLMTGDALRDQPESANAIIKAYLRWLDEQLAAGRDTEAAAFELRLAAMVAAHQAALAESQAARAEVNAERDGLTADLSAHQAEIAGLIQRLNDLAAEANRLLEVARGETSTVLSQLAAANAAAQHQATRADLATSLGMHLAAGDTPAAVAAMRALRRVELFGRQAQVAAELAELTAPMPTE